MDKDLATRLLDAIEVLIIENMAMRKLLKDSKHPSFERVLEFGRNDPAVRARIAKLFDPLRAQIRDDANLESVLQEFLRVVPTSKSVN